MKKQKGPSKAPKRLAAWRRKNKIHQDEAAARFRVARQTYSGWESGRKAPEMAKWFEIHQETGGDVPWHAWAPARLAELIRRLVPAGFPEHVSGAVGVAEEAAS